nr:hypothetical protein [Tanacetum cinerariifolium]
MEEEESRALKRANKSQAEKAAKKQKLNEKVAELKKHLQIVPNDEDDVYTEATPLARKVPVVDYEIYTEINKPYYKIIRADGSPQLFLSFLSLLTNFNREDLEVLWKLVKEIFASSNPKNLSDDFRLTTLTYMFEKPDVQAQVWKNQRTVHGLAKDAIAANKSRAEKKKKCRVVCHTHGVGSAHHARSDGIPASVPTITPRGLAILFSDVATQIEVADKEDEPYSRLQRSISLLPFYNLEWK